MTLTFKQFINESINDRGCLKAVFVIGLPGAGKSFTIKKITGQISPVIVNTDKAAEFLSKKRNVQISKETWHEFQDSATQITKTSLKNYLNGLLPLFVDGTSNNASNILHRIGILESLGYDVGIVYVKTDLETALRRVRDRAKEIGRHVDEDFVRGVHKQSDENAEYLKSKVQFFRTVQNSSDVLDNEALLKAFKAVQGFFAEPLKNPVGKRILEKMKTGKMKYLAPEVFSDEELLRKVDGWYKT